MSFGSFIACTSRKPLTAQEEGPCTMDIVISETEIETEITKWWHARNF
jgi:hypothetical protein